MKDLEDIRLHLNELLSEVSVFPERDLLVNISDLKCIKYNHETIPIDTRVKSILREAQIFEKKTGVSCLCVTYGTFSTTHNNTPIEAPIFIQHIESSISKNSNTVEFTELGEKELNPFLKKYFDKSLDENQITNIESFKTKLGIPAISINESVSYIGNFDPKRYAFIRELKSLLTSEIYSNAIIEAYGNNSEVNVPIKNNLETLFPIDSAQNKIYREIQNQSIVLQGPPGTGKSQLLSNFIGTSLSFKNKSLIVSEKQAAIDVLLNKIKAKNLDALCFKIPSKHANRAFITSLKESWSVLEDNPSLIQQKTFEDLKSFEKKYKSLIQVAQNENGSLQDLLKILDLDIDSSYNSKGNDLNFNSLKWLEKRSLSHFKGLSEVLKHLKPECFKKEFSFIKNIADENLKDLPKNIETWEQLKALQEASLLHQTMDTRLYKKYNSCIQDEGALFFALQKKYKKTFEKVEQLKIQQEHWKINPTNAELDFLESIFKRKNGLALRKWFVWRKFTRTPQLNALVQIKNYRNYIKSQDELKRISKQFKKIGIDDFHKEEAQILSLLKVTDFKKLKTFQEQDKNQYNLHQYKLIYTCYQNLKQYFSFENQDQLRPFLSLIISKQVLLTKNWLKIKVIPSEVLPFWDDNMEFMKRQIQSNLKMKIINSNITLRGISNSEIIKELGSINRSFGLNATIYSQNILNKWSEKFNELDLITKIELRKLNDSQKDLRKKLKKGKSILTKEFAKKRSHKPIRELLESDAALWIDVLKPVWLGNPSLLADHVPMKREMYDFVISDESSQLLLSHSIGALQRGVRSIICGDPEQMAPGSYFKKKQETEMSLLHHAYYHLPKVFLSNHYRSLHPKLITFSNEHFYNNRLLTFQKVTQKQNPIFHHFIENGIYQDRQNIEEAKAVATQVSKAIKTSLKIGVVAFSEVQLALILSYLNPQEAFTLRTKIDENKAFTHALENVQGDECDLLIISMGYGYNENGKFEMRFGPINNFGGHKRLNVLFSRAKQQIHFYSSVKVDDFSKTNNKGILHLIKWFDFMAEDIQNTAVNESITIEEIIEKSKGFHDLLTFYNIFSERGYKIT